MGFIDFLQTDKGRHLTGLCYGFGAAVVIIGALFKIQHWQFAGLFLSIGMGTEAFLFALSGMERPPKDYKWEKVYPGLQEGENALVEQPVMRSSAVVGSQLLEDNEVNRLKESIKNLSATAGQLSTISNASGITDNYVKNIQAASDAAGMFATSQQRLATSTESILQSYKTTEDQMQAVSDQTKNFASHVGTINKNLSSLNTLYELQLKETQSHNDNLSAHNKHYQEMVSNVEQLKSNMSQSTTESEDYKTQLSKLSRQVSELNTVYGNMLNSLNK